jgi:uncharacterized protein involved in cysteine biosynthesis
MEEKNGNVIVDTFNRCVNGLTVGIPAVDKFIPLTVKILLSLMVVWTVVSFFFTEAANVIQPVTNKVTEFVEETAVPPALPAAEVPALEMPAVPDWRDILSNPKDIPTVTE